MGCECLYRENFIENSKILRLQLKKHHFIYPLLIKILSVYYEIIFKKFLKVFSEKNSCWKHGLPYIKGAVISYRTLLEKA